MEQLNSSRVIHGQELAFDEARHRYLYAGTPVPSVTTILQTLAKPALIPWAVKMTSEYWLEAMKAGRTDFEAIHKESKGVHRKKAEYAANIGTNVHQYAEAFLRNSPLPDLKTDESKRSVEAFHKWVDENKLKVLAIERRVYSKQYNYAGTMDLVAELDGMLGVVDYKTGSGIYPEMQLQTAAYQHALQEEKNIKIDVRWIIRFDKVTGEPQAKPFHDFESDFMGFRGALDLHKSLKAMTGKKK